jgi:uncharacterized membrane protein (UPF0127 family)
MLKIKVGNKTVNVKDCRGLGSLRGLMFDRMEDKDGALIHGNAVWMPFVRCKLDLFFLDEMFSVLDVQKAVPMTARPTTWKVYKCVNAKYCLELKHGLVKAKKGEKLEIIKSNI